MTIKTSATRTRLTLFILPSILKHAKAEALVKEISLSTLVEKALISYLPDVVVVKKPNL